MRLSFDSHKISDICTPESDASVAEARSGLLKTDPLYDAAAICPVV